jgi:hypothetical protein|uniref:Uncharacterized protein n=1 Tax=Mus musculus TaxID=10090 RepID=Q3UQD6_MOUSE|nr:unnamed protein product [Mus musculus]
MSGLSRTRQNCFGVRTPILSPQPPAGSTAATVPGRFPGSAPATDNGDSGNAEPAPAGPLTQCPGSAGLLHGPGSIAGRAQKLEVQMETESETPAPALGRDQGSHWARNGAERTRGKWPRVLIAEEASKPCLPSLGPAPLGSNALPALPSIPPGRSSRGCSSSPYRFDSHTQAAMHSTVMGPILDKSEIIVFKVQFKTHMCAPRS